MPKSAKIEQEYSQDFMDKWQKALAQRGRELIAVGYLAFVVTGYFLWLLNSTNKHNGSTFITYLIIVAILLVYLVYAGRYLIHTPGKATNTLLIISSVSMLILVRGLIPIIVFFSLLVTYFKYRKDNKTLSNSGRSAWKVDWTKKEIIWSVIAIVVGAAGYIGGAISASQSPTSTNYFTSNTSPAPYTSTQYGFSIDFPGNPTATDSSVQVQGVSVPTTSYERDNNNGNTIFYVTVDNYPSQFDMSDTKARLEGALNGEVGNVKGATLVSSSYGTVAGYTSITGHATVSDSGQTFDMYNTSLLKGNTLYNILTVGASESDFNNFANSFQFTQ